MDLLKSIDVFREVCRRMSFSQAADRLNLVPSAVSRQVNELERYLGVRLLERTTRSISQGVRELRSLSQESARVEGHIRLTGPPILDPQFLHAALNAFLHQYPDVSLSATFVNREINLEGRCDANDDLMLRGLACAGQGIVYLPAYSVQEHMGKGELLPLLTNYLPEALPISLVYPSRQHLGKAKRALIDHLIGHAERHPLSDPN